MSCPDQRVKAGSQRAVERISHANTRSPGVVTSPTTAGAPNCKFSLDTISGLWQKLDNAARFMRRAGKL